MGESPLKKHSHDEYPCIVEKCQSLRKKVFCCEIDTFDGAKPRFSNRGKKHRFHRQAQDTEFIEVQHQP